MRLALLGTPFGSSRSNHVLRALCSAVLFNVGLDKTLVARQLSGRLAATRGSSAATGRPTAATGRPTAATGRPTAATGRPTAAARRALATRGSGSRFRTRHIFFFNIVKYFIGYTLVISLSESESESEESSPDDALYIDCSSNKFEASSMS